MEDPGEDLHRRRATAGSTHRRKSIKERTFIQRISDRINSSMEEDKERTFIHRISNRIRSSTAVDQGEELHSEDQRQDQVIESSGSRSDLHRQRIRENFYIDWRRREVHPLFRARIGRTSSTIRFRSDILSLSTAYVVKKAPGVPLQKAPGVTFRTWGATSESTWGAIQKAPGVPFRKHLGCSSGGTWDATS